MLSADNTILNTLSLTGIKIAYVVSNKDPKCQERILVRVLGVHDLTKDFPENAVWANHCAPFRSSSGDLPQVGDYVYVVFPNSADPMSIIWLGFVRSSIKDGVEGTDDSIKQPQKSLE